MTKITCFRKGAVIPQPAPKEGPSTLVLRWPWGADGQSEGWEGDCRGSEFNERLCTSLGMPGLWQQVTAMEGQLSGLGEALQGVQTGTLGLLVLALPLGSPLGSQFLHQKRGDDLHPSHLLGGGTEGLLPRGERSQQCPPVGPVASPVTRRALGGQGRLSCPHSSSMSVSGRLPPGAPTL